MVLEFDLGSLERPAYQGPADGKTQTGGRQCYVVQFVRAGHWETEVVFTAKSKETVLRNCGRSTAVSNGRMETYSADQQGAL